MPEYDNNMRGVLFKNDKKESDNHPDYKGNAEVDGVEYWLSAWIKTPKNGGAKFMSMSFKCKDDSQQPKDQAKAEHEPQHQPIDEDSIPF